MRDAERVDVIIEADTELAREEMRDVVFAQMKLGFENLKRKLLGEMLGAVADNLADGSRVARSRRRKAHHRKKLAEKREKASADDRVAVKIATRVAVTREGEERGGQRVDLGIESRTLDKRGGGDA